MDRVRQCASAHTIYVLKNILYCTHARDYNICSIAAESLDHAARKSNRTRCVRAAVAEIAGRALIGGKSDGGAGIHVGRN